MTIDLLFPPRLPAGILRDRRPDMEPMSYDALKLIADRFKLLTNPTRLEILQHICETEHTVGELVSLTGFKQANVSKQLS
ncbi:MAG: ArsR family transcriptional regulator, partial [Planctomycetota bacterium]